MKSKFIEFQSQGNKVQSITLIFYFEIEFTFSIKIFYSFISQLKMLKDDDFSVGFKKYLIVKYVTWLNSGCRIAVKHKNELM